MNPFDPRLQSLAWTLLHFLWQGCLVWGLTALSLRLARRSSAQLRYVLGMLGLSLCLALPVLTYLTLRPRVLEGASLQINMPVADTSSGAPSPAEVEPAFVQDLTHRVEHSTRSWMPWVVQAWFLGSLLLALRLAGGWIGLRQLQHRARTVTGPWQRRLERMSIALGLWRSPRFMLSDHVQSPLVVGWLWPMLLMPAGFLSGLDPTAVEALLAHELAHIRRHDYVVNFTQCVVEILLFYHPAIWWISRRVRTERELCCDDVAVAWCDDPQLYAETLNHLHELRSRSLSPALAAGGGDLMFRIKRLLIPSPIPSGNPRRFNVAALVCAMTLLLTMGFSVRLLRAGTPKAGQTDWFISGSNRKDFKLAEDPATPHGGKASTSLSCELKDVTGFGTLMQTQSATTFLGKRVRMSAWVKAEAVDKWAGLWLRVDGEKDACLGFDNMGKAPIKGTLDWKRYTVVLDVAPEAQKLAFGLLLDGPGHVWLSDLTIEVVDAGVAITNTGGGPATYAGGANLDARNWFLAGSRPQDYTISLDPQSLRDGSPTHLLASTAMECKGFGTLMQGIQGKAYFGKRVRLSAWVRAEQVENWAGLWMRVDGPNGVTGFDNMENRPIKGTQDWNRHSVVLDVAADSKGLSMGILTNGKGKVWMTEPTLEIVDASVPVTHMP